MTETVTLPRSVVEQALEALKYEKDANNPLDWHHDKTMHALRAALEQPQDHPEQNLDMVPEGWKLVPMEPADSQIRAAQDTWWHVCNCETYWDQIYAAMIAAAPQPPAVKESLTADQPQSVTNCHQSQPKREPLTDAQINDHRLALPYDGEDLPDPWAFKQGVRAAERAHKIGGGA